MLNHPNRRALNHPNRRAWDLLFSHLSPSQRYTLEEWGFFYVRGSDDRLYALWDGWWVHPIKKGKATGKAMGVHAKNKGVVLPIGDLLLLQKLALETNARKCRRIACKWEFDRARMPEALWEGRAFWSPRTFFTAEILEDARKILEGSGKSKRRWYKRLLWTR